MIKLNVPIHKQKRKDMACGFICLQMVLGYYNKKLTYNEIIKLAKLDPKVGCWWAQMGCVALDLGFKAELINYNLSNIYDADIAKLKGKKLIERLKRQKRKIDKMYYPEIKYDIDMIRKGGKLILKIPKKKDLINWLKKGIPPILSIKIGPAYGGVPSKKRRKTLDQHGVVVYGCDGKNFLIRDPSPSNKWVLKKLPEDLLMYSWYRGKAYTLLIHQ